MIRQYLARVEARVTDRLEAAVREIGDTNNARLDQVSGQLDGVRRETVEVRRIVTDDLDASNEVAALLGERLAALDAAMESLRREVAELRARLDR